MRGSDLPTHLRQAGSGASDATTLGFTPEELSRYPLDRRMSL